jgi:hypothetical protein
VKRWHIQFVAAAVCWLHIPIFPAGWFGLVLAGACNFALGYENYKRGI